MPVAAAATAMLCRLIILPITPPREFDAAISIAGSKPEPVRRDDLQVAEQRVRRRVAAGQEHAEPAEQGAEEREQRAGGGEGQAERRRRAASSSSGTRGRARRRW